MPNNTAIRIMIADDAVEFRRTVRMMLAHEREFEVVGIAKDGVEAVEMAEYLKPDLAILDINMPRKDGLAAIAEIAKVSPQTICMIMSSESQSGLLKQAISLGVKEYLIKPFTPEEFVAGVKKVSAALYESKKKNSAAVALEAERDRLLLQLVTTHLQAKRIDEEAVKVYVDYATRPQTDPKILHQLAHIFLSRKDWRTLKIVCEKMLLAS